MKHRLYIDCKKHGHHWAMPLINGGIEPHEKWPADVDSLPRICAMCLVESMVQPIRRAA